MDKWIKKTSEFRDPLKIKVTKSSGPVFMIHKFTFDFDILTLPKTTANIKMLWTGCSLYSSVLRTCCAGHCCRFAALSVNYPSK